MARVACGIFRVPICKSINLHKLVSRDYGYATSYKLQNEIFKHRSLNICASSNVVSSSRVEFSISRSYCDQRKNDIFKPQKRSFPQLMKFPEIVWPSILKSIKNWILIHFIIRAYFDRDFNLSEFIAGARQALQVISNRLAEGDLAGLCGLVSSEAIAEMKKVLPTMSMLQRSELRVDKNDIYLTFPYEVGIMFDESTDKTQKRWVEITMVFHVLQGLKDLQNSTGYSSLNLGTLPEYKHKVSICNYRFIKEVTQGQESDWTVNIISHFKPADFVD